jgi:hypothetical protein
MSGRERANGLGRDTVRDRGVLKAWIAFDV